MSQAVGDPVGPAPETHSIRFITLLLGACAAPVFWLGQLMLGYGITAYVCFPGDHPQTLASAGPLFAALIAFDAAALLACAVGGVVSWRAWQSGRQRRGHEHLAISLSAARNRFLAIWGLMSSLWFFVAILFNVIASVMVPPCLS